MIPRTTLLGIAVGALLTPLLVTSYFALAGVKADSKKDADAPRFSIKRVLGVPAKISRLDKRYRASCTIRPRHIYGLSANVDGKIVYIRDNAEPARKGDVVIAIDNETIRYQYQTSLNTLKLLRMSLARHSRSAGVHSKAKIDELQVQVANANTEADYYREQINSFQIKAPAAGLFEKPDAEIGGHVSSMQPLTTLYGTSAFEVDVSVPLPIFEQFDTTRAIPIGSIDDDTPIATARFASYEPEKNGEFVKLTGALPDYDNRGGHIYRKCSATLSLHATDSGIFLPNKYVHLDNRGFFVFSLNGRRAQKKYVQMAYRGDGMVTLMNGVSEGEIILTAGSFKLIDNEIVDADVSE